MKLYELIAVEGGHKGQAEKTRADLVNTFDKKRHHFMEQVVTFTSNVEGSMPVTEKQLSLQATVHDELEWITGIWAKALDMSYLVADGNTKARADVVLEDGTELMKDVPATALLELEKRAAEMHALAMSVPTLDPAKGFQPDANRGRHIYRAAEDVKPRTQKQQIPLVLYEATKEHPAQVNLVSHDVLIGSVKTQEWSGLVTPAEKAEMIGRAEMLQRAIKKARSRANAVEMTDDVKIGVKLLNFVFNGEKGS